MYQFTATVYELSNHDRYDGELWQVDGSHRQIIVSAHIVRLREGGSELEAHEHILRGLSELCVELSQNVEQPLF